MAKFEQDNTDNKYVSFYNTWQEAKGDRVNSPTHYTQGTQEAIDIIEDAIAEAPTPMAGMCQGNALKYLLRLWHKIDAKEDAEKAKWYLNKLIELLD